jgi:imidazolonepropionase-like amidohydrolase
MKIVKRRGAAPRFLLKRRGRQARGFHMGYLLGDHSARSVSDARFGGTMAMRNALAFGGSLLIASTAAAQTEKVPPADRSAAGVTAFVGVSVVPGDRARVQHDQTVLVERARIVRMGPAAKVRVPEGATHIDGKGKYLMPGIGDMHGHLWRAGWPDQGFALAEAESGEWRYDRPRDVGHAETDRHPGSHQPGRAAGAADVRLRAGDEQGDHAHTRNRRAAGAGVQKSRVRQTDAYVG